MFTKHWWIPESISKFTGDKASISRKVGGKFSVFDGYSEGANLELIPDTKSSKPGVPVTGRKVIIPKLLSHSKKSRAGQDFISPDRRPWKTIWWYLTGLAGLLLGSNERHAGKVESFPILGLVKLSNEQAFSASFTPFPVRIAPERWLLFNISWQFRLLHQVKTDRHAARTVKLAWGRNQSRAVPF